MTTVTLRLLALPELSEAVGDKELTVEFEGTTVRELLDHLVACHGPRARRALYDEDGELDLVIQGLVNERDWVNRERLDTPLSDGDSVVLMMLMAGG